MKRKVLIISPYFPPSNAADMQRVRMSLSYFTEFGWDAEVVTVDEKYTELVKDELLLQSIPAYIKTYKVKAFHKKWTSVIGLGSIALRSLWFYRQKVNSILKAGKFDLIYFSTTQFPVCVLGAYWKRKFNIPYVIDMQDAWHSDYYNNKPKEQRPSKYWFSYRLNKYLEPIAMKGAGGLISVSDSYIFDLKARYTLLKFIPSATITFGAFDPDLKIAIDNQHTFKSILQTGFINIVYIGRGGSDMHKAIIPIFKALKNGLINQPELFSQVKLYFIGTSYAPSGKAKPSILPLAKKYEVDGSIIEITDRISYYHTLLTLQQAHALFVPGSDDPKYTASKIYPYLLTKKTLLAIFNANSPAIPVLKEYGVKEVYNYDDTEDIDVKISSFLIRLINGGFTEQQYCSETIKKYSARNRTQLQCELFNQVCERR